MRSNDEVIKLPADYPLADLLAFHARDAQQIAERTGPDWLEKAFVWQGRAVVLRLDFRPGEARLHLDGDADDSALRRRVSHMLGLAQPVEAFEAHFARHAQIGPLIRRRQGLRIPQSATPFEALSWAITGQQISLAAALSLRRRMIVAAGPQHVGGLCCYPDASALASLGEEGLRKCGFSSAKAACLQQLAEAVACRQIVLPEPEASMSEATLMSVLGGLRGIGPWTRRYTLLRGYAAMDVSLQGDVAVRRGIERLCAASAALTMTQAEVWLAPFSPWRALVAAHLWASGST